jgi:hypothetical protein
VATSVDIDDGAGETIRFTYAALISTVLTGLYNPVLVDQIPGIAEDLFVATEPTTGNAARRAGAKAATKRLAVWKAAALPVRDFPYDNHLESFAGVSCTDGPHPKDTALWPTLTDAPLGPGDQLSGGGRLRRTATGQPAAVKRQLGPHGLRHIGLRDRGRRRLPARRHPAEGRHPLQGLHPTVREAGPRCPDRPGRHRSDPDRRQAVGRRTPAVTPGHPAIPAGPGSAVIQAVCSGRVCCVY